GRRPYPHAHPERQQPPRPSIRQHAGLSRGRIEGIAPMYDVIIVGARCAGSALALMLARDGLRVLMVDRATFPSDTMSGHFIHVAGMSALRRLGLFEEVLALGAPAQETMTVDFGPVVLSGSPVPAADGTSVGCAPRRYAFDAMLANAAI